MVNEIHQYIQWYLVNHVIFYYLELIVQDLSKQYPVCNV